MIIYVSIWWILFISSANVFVIRIDNSLTPTGKQTITIALAVQQLIWLIYVYVSVSENENAYAKNVDIFGAWDEFLCVFRCQTLGLCTFSSYSSVYVAFTVVGCVFVTSKKFRLTSYYCSQIFVYIAPKHRTVRALHVLLLLLWHICELVLVNKNLLGVLVIANNKELLQCINCGQFYKQLCKLFTKENIVILREKSVQLMKKCPFGVFKDVANFVIHQIF